MIFCTIIAELQIEISKATGAMRYRDGAGLTAVAITCAGRALAYVKTSPSECLSTPSQSGSGP